MTALFQALGARIETWREAGYPCNAYPAIAEILGHAFDDTETPSLRFLRAAQFRAVEVYWYLRLELDTPRIPDLYEELFPEIGTRIEALGISADLFKEANFDFSELFERVRTDDAFVRENALESLRETLTLDYPSYILALAMGAGKTVLMGAIVATEFAMADEYPDGPFVQNALVFAPGKTIIQSLRELADMPFEAILPPRMYKRFAANLKLTFTRDGDRDISVIGSSIWNVVVTNTEKIRIQKPTARKQTSQLELLTGAAEDEAEEVANLRLQKIASLPHLAVFSDEAHRTYGQQLLGKWARDNETGDPVFRPLGLKKVRRTVDYLAEHTNLIVVVNTTGTPFFRRQPLRDVVVWYGLGEGIRDGVLKEVADNIHEFSLGDDRSNELVARVVGDFVEEYWAVHLPDGAPARLALYFPSTAALESLRPAVETALLDAGAGPESVLAAHSKSTQEVRAAFDRVAVDPDSPHRVLLLVNIGTEGWNCPSLFACGLIRKLRSSSNLVLQAATRCLRQVPGNDVPARIYLSSENRPLLASQLEETFGTSLDALNQQRTDRVHRTVELRRPALPPLLVKKRVVRYRRKDAPGQVSPLTLTPSDAPAPPSGRLVHWSIVEPDAGVVSLLPGQSAVLDAQPRDRSAYAVATELAGNYHLPADEVLSALRAAYGEGTPIPDHHLRDLGCQIEDQRSSYEPYEEVLEVAVALVRAAGFEREVRETGVVYTARVSFAKERADLYRTAQSFSDPDRARTLSFHYEGYNFDSHPEAAYLEQVLKLLDEHPDALEGVWFTGGLTDPGKTELFAEYLGGDGRWHRYTPDFVLRRRSDGKHLIVEIKSDQHREVVKSDLSRHAKGEAPVSPEGRKAVAIKRWENLDPERLSYEVIFAGTSLPIDALDGTRNFIEGAS